MPWTSHSVCQVAHQTTHRHLSGSAAGSRRSSNQLCLCSTLLRMRRSVPQLQGMRQSQPAWRPPSRPWCPEPAPGAQHPGCGAPRLRLLACTQVHELSLFCGLHQSKADKASRSQMPPQAGHAAHLAALSPWCSLERSARARRGRTSGALSDSFTAMATATGTSTSLTPGSICEPTVCQCICRAIVKSASIHVCIHVQARCEAPHHQSLSALSLNVQRSIVLLKGGIPAQAWQWCPRRTRPTRPAGSGRAARACAGRQGAPGGSPQRVR